MGPVAGEKKPGKVIEAVGAGDAVKAHLDLGGGHLGPTSGGGVSEPPAMLGDAESEERSRRRSERSLARVEDVPLIREGIFPSNPDSLGRPHGAIL